MLKYDLERRIREIENDERLKYKTATIVENAPLALIQLSLEIELKTLKKVLYAYNKEH